MVNTKYISTEDMISKSQEFKGKRELTFCENICNYYDNMNIGMNEGLC